MHTGDGVVIPVICNMTFAVSVLYLIHGIIFGMLRMRLGASLNPLDSLATTKHTKTQPNYPKELTELGFNQTWHHRFKLWAVIELALELEKKLM